MSQFKEFSNNLRARGFIVVSETRRASVKEVLTEQERQQIASEMAQQIAAAETKEEDIKTVTTQMKGELQAIKGASSLNAGILNAGYRMMVKPVVVVADFDRRARIFLDPETGEQVGTEPLQDSDFQARLGMEE
jgi:hypothetical protein